MVSRFLVAVAASFLCGCTSGVVKETLDPVHDVASLEHALRALTTQGASPTILVVVVKNGRDVFIRGFTMVRSAPTSDGDQGFNLWSISKIATSLAVLELSARGRVDLDSPIAGYVAWLEGVSNISHVTARSLLNHTAGIPDMGMALYAQTAFDGDALVSQMELARMLLPDPSRWRNSGTSEYSNSHYLLLAGVIESITGKPFHQVVDELVLQPMQMSNSGYRYKPNQLTLPGSHPKDLMSLLAFFYVDKQRAVRDEREGRYWFNPVYNNSLGSTGLLSTPADISMFMKTLLSCLNGRASAVSPSVCSSYRAAGVAVAASPAGDVKGLTQRLGWFVAPTPRGVSYAHGGSGMGFTSMLRLYPETDLGVFVIANDSYFDRSGGLLVTDAIAAVEWQ